MSFLLRDSASRLRCDRPRITQLLASLLLGSSLAIAAPALSQLPRKAQARPAPPSESLPETQPESPTERESKPDGTTELKSGGSSEASEPEAVSPAVTSSEENSSEATSSEANTPEATEQTNADRIPFPDAGITLIPPVNFELADLFDGFQQEATQASVMVLSFPAPTEAMLKAFGDEAGLAQKGMTLMSNETVNISGQPGLLVQLEQEAHGLTFGKWILIFGENNQTTVINASFPQEFADELSAPLKASLLSTQVDEGLIAISPEDSQDFSLTPTDGMALALDISGTLLYSEGGELNGEDPTAPLFIVSPSFSDVAAPDPGEFARDRLQQTEQVKAIEIVSEAPITIDRLEGHEIIATGQDSTTATPLLIYQTILFAEERYYIMQGLVGEEGGGEDLADFKAMAESFRRE